MRLLAAFLLTLLAAGSANAADPCVYFGGYPWQPNGCLTSADLNAAFANALAPATALAPGVAATNLGNAGGEVSGPWSNLQVARPLPNAAMPIPTLSALGGVRRTVAVPGTYLTGINASGVPTTATALVPTNNLADVASTATARTNIGLAIGSVTDPAYGADPLGIIDSTLALNNAFAAYPTGAVYMPCGDYKISGTVTMASRVQTPARGCVSWSWVGGNNTNVLLVPADGGGTFLGVKKEVIGGLTIKNTIGATGLTFVHVLDTNRSAFYDLVVDATNGAGAYSTGHTCLFIEASTSNSGLNSFYNPVLFGCKTGVKLRGADASHVATDNSFYGAEIRLGNAETGAIGVDEQQWADTNNFFGTTLIALQSNNSTCNVKNSASPLSNVGVYDNNFYFLACDAFGVTGATGIKINYTKQFTILGFYHSPDTFPGTLIDENTAVSQSCYILNNSTGTGVNAAMMQVYHCGTVGSAGIDYSSGVSSSKSGGGLNAAFRSILAGTGGFSWGNTNQGTDEKYWDMITELGGHGALSVRAVDDASSGAVNAITIRRGVGLSIASVDLTTPNVIGDLKDGGVAPTGTAGTGYVRATSPALAGAPTAPTAAAGTTTTQVATTAYVQANAGDVLISTQVASSSATLDFTALGAFKSHRLVCTALVPATNAVNVLLRIGEGGGPTWAAGATDYNWVYNFKSPTFGSGYTQSAGTTAIQIGGTVTNTSTNGGVSFVSDLNNVATAAMLKSVHSTSRFYNGTDYFEANGSGWYLTDGNAWTGIRVLMSSGNIASGQCSLYGRPT